MYSIRYSDHFSPLPRRDGGSVNNSVPRVQRRPSEEGSRVEERRPTAARSYYVRIDHGGGTFEHYARNYYEPRRPNFNGGQADDNVQVNGVMEFKSDVYGIQSQFSTDVLRLEIGGPDQEHLSVIDVPGLFQRHKEGVTTKADIELVKRMVEGYMSNPRSVMLTVIPSNVDIATQGILENAEVVDAKGKRTLGVLTKPDLVDKGAEHNVVNLIEDREHRLTLGWHLLRNAGQSELSNSIEDRLHAETDFFNTVAPWKDLNKDKVGISSFRSRLQEVLSDHIRKEFPQVYLTRQ